MRDGEGSENHIQSTETPSGETSELKELCASIHARLTAFLETPTDHGLHEIVQAQCRRSIGVIDEALKRYPLHALSLSYNGGKDCLVLLILYLFCLSKHDELGDRVPSIYIPHIQPFPLVDEFVASSSQQYRLDLTHQATPHGDARYGMKEAFATYLSSPKGRSVKAIFVGTRRTDPHGASLQSFDPTNGGWPAFMRIHPVLEWRYVEVWAFLRHLNIAYCSLYDAGYTSLGGVGDTHPNPALRYHAANGQEAYRPAYELQEDDAERRGRD